LGPRSTCTSCATDTETADELRGNLRRMRERRHAAGLSPTRAHTAERRGCVGTFTAETDSAAPGSVDPGALQKLLEKGFAARVTARHIEDLCHYFFTLSLR
jgi:hypothetical protein